MTGVVFQVRLGESVLGDFYLQFFVAFGVIFFQELQRKRKCEADLANIQITVVIKIFINVDQNKII